MRGHWVRSDDAIGELPVLTRIESERDSPVRRVSLGDCLVEVSQGIGPKWQQYDVLGATRGGIAAAKEPVGKHPERYKLVAPGTIFYNPMRILLGSIAFVDEDDRPGVTSPDYVVFKTRLGLLHPRWFYYWLRSTDGAVFIRTLVRGAVRERMLFRRLAEATFDVPPWDQQVVVADALRSVRHARSAAHTQLDAARKLAPLYTRDVFGVTASQRWPTRRLGDLLHLRKDVVHPRNNPTGQAVFVGLEHVEPHTGVRTGCTSVDLSRLTGRKPRFRQGDIVYGYLRPYLNKVWVAEFDGICSVDQYVFSVDASQAEADFVAAFMRSGTYLSRAPVAGAPGQLPRIRTEEVASVGIEVPPVEEQRRALAALQERLSLVTRVCQAAEAAVTHIDSLTGALVQSAFAKSSRLRAPALSSQS